MKALLLFTTFNKLHCNNGINNYGMLLAKIAEKIIIEG